MLCSPCCIDPCPPADVTADCVIPAAAVDDAQIAAICGAVGPSGAITMTEVGQGVDGEAIVCNQAGIIAPDGTIEVTLAGLTPGCIALYHLSWGETTNSVNGCNGTLGGDVVYTSGAGTALTVPTKIFTDNTGYDYFVPTLAESVWWSEVLTGGTETVVFDFDIQGVFPPSGLAQIQVFQICGTIDTTNPFKAFVTGGTDQPATALEGESSLPVTITLPTDPCPAVWVAGARHTDWAGGVNPDGAFGVNGAGGSVATEEAEYVSAQNDFCQIGSGGGIMTGGDSIEVSSAMNIDNYFGDITNQAIFGLLRVNCDVPPPGGESVVSECCVDITNNVCNETEQVDQTVSVDVQVTADIGSNIGFELVVAGVVEDTFFIDNTAGVAPVSGASTLTFTGVLGPLAAGVALGDQCAQVRFDCVAYAGTGNAASVTAGSNSLDINI